MFRASAQVPAPRDAHAFRDFLNTIRLTIENTANDTYERIRQASVVSDTTNPDHNWYSSALADGITITVIVSHRLQYRQDTQPTPPPPSKSQSKSDFLMLDPGLNQHRPDPDNRPFPE